ncbi:TIGR00268 family protein [Streptomyces sp. MAR4 CNX-425]|uniref:TIGR00268 family protein n=1 Tax=Streptomyces sp. MAR4 CNX-425 TaxID=3406343 RepID=UPI003B50BA1A
MTDAGPAATETGAADAAAAAAALLDEVGRLGSVAVAYSGGVDSTVVLAAAVRALGPGRAVAVIADSPALARGELALARDTAAGLGAELVVLDTDELSVAGYRANAGDRCYFCKQTVLGRVAGYAAEHGFAHVATGTHRDDRRAAHRPGLRAAKELDAAEPLAAAGLGKAAVRAVARAWGLPVAEKPGMPCLASRIAVGVPVSKDRLHLVERAEERVRATLDEHRVGARDVRVRLLKHGFRIELDAPAHREVAAAHGLGDTLLREAAAVGPLGEGSLTAYAAGAVSTAARAAAPEGAPTR